MISKSIFLSFMSELKKEKTSFDLDVIYIEQCDFHVT